MTTSTNLMVLSENPQLDDSLILRLQYDLATGMHTPEIIARRYGLKDEFELRDYLRQHPMIVWEARRVRALYSSDEATEERIRAKFLQATEFLIRPMTALVNDTRTPIQQRIDGFKQIQRGAGVDGAPAAARAGQQAGTAFSLTINFAGGRGAQHIEGVAVADPNSIPLPVGATTWEPSGGAVEGITTDAEFEEEV